MTQFVAYSSCRDPLQVELDEQLLTLLGPKTAEDEKKPEKKKVKPAKAPKEVRTGQLTPCLRVGEFEDALCIVIHLRSLRPVPGFAEFSQERDPNSIHLASAWLQDSYLNQTRSKTE